MKRTNKKRTRRNKRVQKSRRNKRVHKLKRTNGIRQMGGRFLTDEEEEDIIYNPDFQVFNDMGARDLKFKEELESGTRGSVHKGLLYPGTLEEKRVAIKLYNSKSTWYDSFLQFKKTKDITFQKVDGGPHLKVNNTLKYGRVIFPTYGGQLLEEKECSIMELYEGKDLLGEAMERSNDPDLSEIKMWAGQILRQLIALHEVCGHGDIKPDNIAIEIEADGSTYLRLIDFDKFVGGTELYQARELHEIKDERLELDHHATIPKWLQRCDMYSFGMTILKVCRRGPAVSNAAKISDGFRDDTVFMEVINNLLNYNQSPADRYTAVQAYEKLFPDEAVLLSAAAVAAEAVAAEAAAAAEAVAAEAAAAAAAVEAATRAAAAAAAAAHLAAVGVKCPNCQRKVNVSEIEGQEGYQTCETCRQEDADRADAGW
jgi:hypothetical protein